MLMAAVAAVGLSGCGGESDEPPDPPTARVEVRQTFEPPKLLGEHGTRSFAVIERARVEVAKANGVEHDSERNLTPLLSERLEPGSYRVTSLQRACGPSGCARSGVGTLGAPLARCRTDFQVPGRQPVDILITVDPVAGRCNIETGFTEVGEP